MSKRQSTLSRREREMMDIIYAAGSATANEVRRAMTSPPSYSAVRATLRVLEEKGHLKHTKDGNRYLFEPTVSRQRARKSALSGVLQNFFDNSREQMVATLLDLSSQDLSDEELERLADLIDQARKEGR